MPSVLPSAVISTVACAARGRFQRHIDRETLAAENLAGKPTDSSSRPGLGRPASGTVSIGMPSCCACQMARATLPRFSLPSEISSRRGTMPAGSAADAVANGGFQIGAVPGGAGGVAQLPAFLALLVGARCAGARAQKE